MIKYNTELLNLIIYTGAVIFIAGVIILLSWVLGSRHSERRTGEPYESGIKPTGSARLRFSGKFYIIAMFFVIFDLETIFFIAWAMSFRETGWAGYAAILVFVLFLISILVYEWRSGAFKLFTDGRDVIQAIKKR